MNATVILKTILPVQNITSKDGSKTYVKREFVATEKDSRFPKDICFTLFGEEKTKLIEGIQPGSVLNVNFDIQSREVNGRYFTSIDAWSVKVEGGQAVSQTPPMNPVGLPEGISSLDDIPF